MLIDLIDDDDDDDDNVSTMISAANRALGGALQEIGCSLQQQIG